MGTEDHIIQEQAQKGRVKLISIVKQIDWTKRKLTDVKTNKKFIIKTEMIQRSHMTTTIKTKHTDRKKISRKSPLIKHIG